MQLNIDKKYFKAVVTSIRMTYAQQLRQQEIQGINTDGDYDESSDDAAIMDTCIDMADLFIPAGTMGDIAFSAMLGFIPAHLTPGQFSALRFYYTAARVPSELASEGLDTALNPSLRFAGMRISQATGTSEMPWLAHYATYTRTAYINAGIPSAGMGISRTSYSTTYAASQNLRIYKNVLNGMGISAAKFMEKGVPYFGSIMDFGVIAGTWNHTDTIAKVGGIAGGLLSLAGIIAAPFTFGGSLALSFGGAALSAGTSFF